jgi:2',3'-cyclic-nucleotide 2'-phosphodiesterase (5'-nucleotidase family)
VARWAAYINRQHDPNAGWLTVDAGNYVDRIGNGGCSGKCAFMVTSYRDLHYDVLNIGKQEAWMGKETLMALVDTLKSTQFVSANLVDRKSKRPIVKPMVIRDFGNLRVGIIGLLNEQDFPKGASLLDTVQLEVLPYMDAAKKYIPSLARKVDAVVLLAELPSQAIDTLVKVLPEIDLVITTGAAKAGESVQTSGKKTRVVGTGSSGYAGHYVMLDFDVAGKDSIGITTSLDQLTDTYEEKGAWLDKVTAFNALPQTGQPVIPVAAAKADAKTTVTPMQVNPGGTMKPGVQTNPAPTATQKK